MDKNNWKHYGNGAPYESLEDGNNFESEIIASAKFLRDLHNEYHTWHNAVEAYNEGETVANEVLIYGTRKWKQSSDYYAKDIHN